MASLIDKPVIALRLGKTIKGKAGEYRIVQMLGYGGTGVVYRAENMVNGQSIAIKFFLPIYHLKVNRFQQPFEQQKALEEVQDLFEREVECLRQLRHPSIIPVLDTGVYKPVKNELLPELSMVQRVHFFAMPYVDGPNILKYFASSRLSKTQVLATLSALCDAFIYLHEVCSYLHADIKPTNILVKADSGEPVLIDFSLYKNLNFSEVDAGGVTRVLGDWGLFPADLPEGDPLLEAKSHGLARDQIRQLAFPTLDLFQIGKLLEALQPVLSRSLGTEEQTYLRLIQGELTNWGRARTRNSRWLKSRLELLSPSYAHFMGVEELTPPSSAMQTLQLPGRTIAVSPLVTELAGTRSFRRLCSINQLGFVDTIYPGAGYRRHVHSYHAYSCCVDILGRLAHAPSFRFLYTPELARQTLALALLHDINHCPLLHVLQEADLKKSPELLDLFCNGEATGDTPSIYELVERLGLSRHQFKDVLLLTHAELATKGYAPGLQVAKSLIDSGVDVDKMAYLTDDSLFTGAPYGRSIDISRLLASATVAEVPMSGPTKTGWHLAFSEGGVSAVESLVLARYWMFKTVYWHRANRAVMAMLLHVLKRLYVHGSASIQEFVIDTMWRSEEFVLEYLDTKYGSRFPEQSVVTRDILRSPKTIYNRLLSIQGESPDQSDSNVYRLLTQLDAPALEAYRLKLTDCFRQYMARHSAGTEVDENDLLIDIPRRKLDIGGPVYIVLDTGAVRSLDHVAGPVQRVGSDLDRLAKRVRVFVRPDLVEALGPESLVSRRPELMELAADALPSLGQMR